MQGSEIIQSIFRWLHVVAGIAWIGLLYFFNFVNGPFAATMDGDTKKKVVPELMPRALFFFRWGAAWTWATGILLLLMVFYHGGLLFNDPSTGVWNHAFIVIALTFLGVFIYDILMKKVGTKNLKLATGIGFGLIALYVYLANWAGFSYRAYSIHTGALFGSIMAFNVWFRIWPAQQKIITAVKNGQAPDAAVVALAGQRSKNNTYLSVPLVWTMINAHTTWAATHWAILLAFVLVGWHLTDRLYQRAAKVKGF